MVVIIDFMDSFTYMLMDYIQQVYNDKVITIREDANPLKYIEDNISSLFGIVLSPGPMRPQDHPVIIETIHNYQNKVPILGICLGFQGIASYYGWKVNPINRPIHGKSYYLEITEFNKVMFKGVKYPLTVGLYHSLGVIDNQIDTDLEPTSLLVQEEETLIMSFKHRTKLIWGLQFHPESIMTNQGLMILNNWIDAVTDNE